MTESEPPYDTWRETGLSTLTRLDGPYLFTYQGEVYGVGRFHPDVGGAFTWPGSILSHKRASLFRVTPAGPAPLTDLPGSVDTAYEGLVARGETAYICYYTSPINKHYPWILGMVRPSDVRMADVNLASLASVGREVQ